MRMERKRGGLLRLYLLEQSGVEGDKLILLSYSFCLTAPCLTSLLLSHTCSFTRCLRSISSKHLILLPSPSSFHTLLLFSLLPLPFTPSITLISSYSDPYRVLERVWDDPFAASFIEPVDCDTYDDYLGNLFVLYCTLKRVLVVMKGC